MAKDLAFQTNLIEGAQVDLDDRNIPDGERVCLLSPKDRGQVRGPAAWPRPTRPAHRAPCRRGILRWITSHHVQGLEQPAQVRSEAIAATVLVDGAATAGDTTIQIDGVGKNNVNVGHIIAFGGAGKYIVVDVLVESSENTLTLHAPLAAAVANNVAVTAIASTANWRPSFLYDKASFAYVPRVFANEATIVAAGFVDFQRDEESGLELFLEAKRGNNMTQFDVSSGLYSGIVPDAFEVLVPG